MSSRVLVVGFDSCDPDIVRALASEGALPHLADVLARGATAPLRNSFALFVGSVWRSFATARSGHRIGRHCWDEIDPDTYERRLVDISRERGRPFWLDLSDAGRRVAILDVPHARPQPLNGIIVTEWGSHDHHEGLSSWPPDAAAEISSAHGLHPVLGFDSYAIREFAPDDYVLRAGALRTTSEELAMVSGLIEGIAMKQAWVTDLLRSDAWDLFIAVLGEGHAVGHQQWHLHDDSHPRYDAAVVEAVGGDPLLRVYRALDDALGVMLAEADEDTTVVVILSHGMGPHYDGCHFLDETLRRIDIADSGGPLGGFAGRFSKRALLRLPVTQRRRLFSAIAPVVRRVVARRLSPPCAEFVDPNERATQRYFLQPNNSVYGGVRLNVAGRERSGVVLPGDVDAVCEQLAEDLLSLVNVATGEPVVEAVHRADAFYEREATDTLPDLFVDWNRRAQIETVWSPKTGVVHAPYTHWRTGDHRPDGLLIVLDPAIEADAHRPPVRIEDLGPSLAARFGVTLSDADGQPVEWMTPRVPAPDVDGQPAGVD